MDLTLVFKKLSKDQKFSKVKELCKELQNVSTFYQAMYFYLDTMNDVEESILDYIYSATMQVSTMLKSDKSDKMNKHRKLTQELSNKSTGEDSLDINDMLWSL